MDIKDGESDMVGVGEKALDAPQQSMSDTEAMEMLKQPGFVPIAFRQDVNREEEEAKYAEAHGFKPTFDEEIAEPEKPQFTEEGIQIPTHGLIERWRAIARYHALGWSVKQISEKLGYTTSGVSGVLKKPWVRAEIHRYRTNFFDEDINRALKAAGSDAIKHIHNTILDDTEKSELRSTNSRWVVEKLTGKAKQEVNVESNTLAAFTDLLREVRESGRPLEPAVLDITPATLVEDDTEKAEKRPDFEAWLDKEF